jgi:divalent metal cation (Fe/Co/Zn/Cd) transporter
VKLIGQHRPPLGTFAIFGRQFEVWSGWVMIGALAFSIVAAATIGHFKKPIAEELHNKALLADADMNKADYMSESAAFSWASVSGGGTRPQRH